jgi:hypothetical protein
MADIFISYANEDRDRAAQLAALLEGEGWSVWWDRRIPAGRTWRSVLEDALDESRCMIVLWSEHSVNSPWVAEEAEEARRLNKTLVPALIQRVEPPMGFRSIQAADLTQWDGSSNAPDGRQLVVDLRSLLGPRGTTSGKMIEDVAPSETATWFKERSWLASHWPKAALAGFAIAAFVAWQYWPAPNPESSGSPDMKRAQEPSVRRLHQLSINSDRKTIKPSETLKLSLTARYTDGSQSDLSEDIQWLSSDTRVATIDEQGEIKGLRSGTTHIKAKIGDIESPEWILAVENVKTLPAPEASPKLIALNISAVKQELSERERVALRAKGRYSDNSEKYLSGGLEWQSSDRSIASINDHGELVAQRPGKTEVVARSDNLSSPPLTFLIKERRKNLEPAAKPGKIADSEPAKAAEPTPQGRARIAAHIGRAQTFREQGNYPAALAELEKAKLIDSADEQITKEIEQTHRACNAEKVLGNKVDC